MKKHLALFLALTLSIVSAHTASAALEIKLGVVTKPGSAQNVVAEKFKEVVRNNFV